MRILLAKIVRKVFAYQMTVETEKYSPIVFFQTSDCDGITYGLTSPAAKLAGTDR